MSSGSYRNRELNNQQLFIRLRRWKDEVRNIQNPESLRPDLCGYSRAVERADMARRTEGKGNRTPVLVTHGSCMNPTLWGKVWRAPYAGADNNNSVATFLVSVLASQP